MNSLNIFDHCYLFGICWWHSIFSKTRFSIKEVVNSFYTISLFSGLKPNLSKCKIASVGTLKGVKVAVCGLQCVDLNLRSILLGTLLSYNKKLKEETNFYINITNGQCVSQLCKLRSLVLAGKILIFKTLAFSKIIFQIFH